MASYQEQLNVMQDAKPEQRKALVRGEWVPERIAEFKRSRDAEEGRLQNQITQAQQLANSPMTFHGNSTPAAVASIVANALRSFGGMALAGRGESQLKDAQAQSAQQYEGLMGQGEASTEAVKTLEQQALERRRLEDQARMQSQALTGQPWGVPYR